MKRKNDYREEKIIIIMRINIYFHDNNLDSVVNSIYPIGY